MAKNYISDDFASKLERARRKTVRAPQQHRLPSVPFPAPPPQASSLFRVYNAAGETIPEFAVMQVASLTERTGFGGDSREAYSVEKPDGEGTLFLVNAGGEILEGHFGAGMLANEPTKVLIDPSASAEFADTYGPTIDQWYVTTTPVGTLFYLGENDGETGIFEQAARPLTSLVIGVTLGSTAAVVATVHSRPPGWSRVPGESAGLVSITNPSSIALSTDNLSFHATYNTRNDTDQWELVGGAGGSGAPEQGYGCLSNGSTTVAGSSFATYNPVPFRIQNVASFGAVSATTDSQNFGVDADGDYQVMWSAGGLRMDSVGTTGFYNYFSVFKNSSALTPDAFDVQLTVSQDHEHVAASGGITHLVAGDVLDLRVLVGSTVTALFITTAHMSVNLIRTTTTT